MKELRFTPGDPTLPFEQRYALFQRVILTLFAGDSLMTGSRDVMLSVANAEDKFKCYAEVKSSSGGMGVVMRPEADWPLRDADCPEGEFAIRLEDAEYNALKQCARLVLVEAKERIFPARDALDVLDCIDAAKAPAEKAPSV